MLENLIALISEQGQETVVNNPAIPNESNNAVLADATHAVAGGLQSEIASGGLQNVLNMFQGGGSGLTNNPIVQNIIQNFVGKLGANHNISGEQANNIAGNLIPNVLSNLINKTNDPNDSSFDLNGIIGSLTGGGNGSGIQSIVSKFTSGGLDTDKDGQIEISDIISKFTSNNNQSTDNQGSDGLMDMIKGFMK